MSVFILCTVYIQKLYWVGKIVIHTNIFFICLKVLIKSLKVNISILINVDNWFRFFLLVLMIFG